MLLIDGNYVAKRLFHISEDNLDIFRHSFLSNLQYLLKTYKTVIKEVVFAVDSKSWRKDFYSDYQVKSKSQLKNSKDMSKFYDVFTEIINILDKNTNIKIIKSDKAETQDIIYTLSQKKGKHLIYGNHKKYLQLMSNKVFCHDFSEKQIIQYGEEYIKKQMVLNCLIGNPKENIKKVLWNAFPSKVFIKWIKDKHNIDLTQKLYEKLVLEKDSFIEEFKNDMLQDNKEDYYYANKRFGINTAKKVLKNIGLTEYLNSNKIIKYNYEFNKNLLEFKQIPESILKNIELDYHSYKNDFPNLKMLATYCQLHKLNVVKEYLNELVY